MKMHSKISLVLGVCLLQACAEGGISGTGSVTDPVTVDPGNEPTFVDVTGQANKGPFGTGAQVRARMIENDTVRATMTSGLLGEFTVQMHEGLAGQIDVTGKYFSEHLGQMSADPITLSAMVMGDADVPANVNVATHVIHLRLQPS
jgi:hypothetical protein